ncbi:class I SAM-dependent methyltransferase [Oceanidesulfovibrio marinus]|uniref:Class I SAM-dependent methyltransferase n=1 Tax=Oceanidesulfovibrio marinus TaxID=370038 RepID=A0ABX6NFM6_9BACT|nr:class I SAM-dependent methyltransferase [Oceanidesulfovibrio marinus]QJT09423.1 class I SAM-dependent methyltransferase [Oceanidesulfovibrio marinus]
MEASNTALPTLDPALIPPEDLRICFGGGDFEKIGASIVMQLRNWAGLLPSDRVLDVGCGAGRIAAALTGYLSAEGSYEGFDIFPFGVEWCQENVTPRHPNFHFRTVDVYNSVYNPFVPTRAADFVFPYDDASFDVVVLNSVFTHMLPADLANYTAEISRVLAPGGRAFITYFLMDDESRGPARQGHTTPAFSHAYGSFYVEDPTSKEDAVAYEERFIRNIYAVNGLTITRFSAGNWRAIGSPHFQDIVVAHKG